MGFKTYLEDLIKNYEFIKIKFDYLIFIPFLK